MSRGSRRSRCCWTYQQEEHGGTRPQELVSGEENDVLEVEDEEERNRNAMHTGEHRGRRRRETQPKTHRQRYFRERERERKKEREELHRRGDGTEMERLSPVNTTNHALWSSSSCTLTCVWKANHSRAYCDRKESTHHHTPNRAVATPWRSSKSYPNRSQWQPSS
jgi:hypothetical protein